MGLDGNGVWAIFSRHHLGEPFTELESLWSDEDAALDYMEENEMLDNDEYTHRWVRIQDL